MTIRVETQDAIILDDGTLSSAVGLGDAAILGLYIPAIVEAVLKFKGSLTSDGTYTYIKDNDNNEISVAGTTGNYWLGSEYLKNLVGCPFVKVESSVAQTGGPETFVFILKRFGR